MRIIKKIKGAFSGKRENRLADPFPMRGKLRDEMKKLARMVQPYTLVDDHRLFMLYFLSKEAVTENILGDMVECGVFNGGSSAVICAGMAGGADRRMWLYDTFTGIPDPGAIDGEFAREYEGKLVGSVEKSLEIIGKTGFPADKIVLRKGDFKDTFKEPLPEKISLLHIDADWYESVMLALRTLYPLVEEGGYTILDDFGHWEGAREAFYDYCREYNIKPLVERIGPTQLFWKKGLINNRSNLDRYPLGVYYNGKMNRNDDGSGKPPKVG